MPESPEVVPLPWKHRFSGLQVKKVHPAMCLGTHGKGSTGKDGFAGGDPPR